MSITSVEQLEETLSRPTPADEEAVRALGGDVLILGVAGKMGPTLARRLRRAADQAGVRMRVIGVSRFSTPAAARCLNEAGIETLAADLLDDARLAALPEAPNVI